MNAEFNVWLLIVGLVVGAGLVWVVMMDSRRQEADVDAGELPREAAWLSAILAEDGHEVSPEVAEEMLLLHRAYLGAPPPDPVEIDSGLDDDAIDDDDALVDAVAMAPRLDDPPTPGSEVAVEDRVGTDRGAIQVDE